MVHIKKKILKKFTLAMGEGFEDQIKKCKKDPAVFTYHGTAMDIHILSICSCNVPAISQKGIFDLVVQTETQES